MVDWQLSCRDQGAVGRSKAQRVLASPSKHQQILARPKQGGCFRSFQVHYEAVATLLILFAIIPPLTLQPYQIHFEQLLNVLWFCSQTAIMIRVIGVTAAIPLFLVSGFKLSTFELGTFKYLQYSHHVFTSLLIYSLILYFCDNKHQKTVSCPCQSFLFALWHANYLYPLSMLI